MPAGVAFMALLMLLESAVSRQPAAPPPLAPPTNLTVTCDDGAAAASWQYQEDADVHFLVYVGDSGRRRPLRDETRRRHSGNLSAWVWESLESVMDVHWVSVAAAAGANRSSDNASVTFTYNSVKMADVMCKLDFPHVDVKASDADDGSAAVIFRNPLRHHPRLSRATRRAAVSLQFIVNSDAGEARASCAKEQNVCRTDVSFPPGSAECVTLTGLVRDSVGRSLALRPSPLVCAPPRSQRGPSLALPLGVSAALLLLLVCAVAAARKVARAVKPGKAAPPEWLFVPPAGPKARVGSCCAADSGAPGLKPRVPLIFPGDDDSSGVCTEVESLPVVLEEAEGEQEPEEPEEPEEEEEEAGWDSNYDRVHVTVGVQMGNGDEAWGYKER
ncbi:interferon gamma receptor 1 [Hippocampus zosterae]|uniref:interferon gamma receptor 1 n=1 Tax=Hippocampus zosterae TaxID=109293 RepID=UPI00223E0C2A|nr:interferon gamma receptor 1 [Hippocampus zosterae]